MQSSGTGLTDEQATGVEPHKHEWGAWKIVGYTGDWFHPRIVERECKTCHEIESDEH